MADPAPTTSTEPARRWHPLAWVALVAATAAVLVPTLGATWLVLAFGGSTCNEPPTADEVWEGQGSLLVILALAGLPWALLATFLRPRVRFVVPGLVCIAAPLVCLVLGLDHDFWRGSFCF
ncbi:MAG: hypothetical protein HOQ22_18650 [Nocardioidaceae bacterium]|nr:hypothetical protein [Nocardioidaceae bacterium]NUS53045.1 hypothetical protein [Nocardioidaceae bacterium]